MTTPFHVPTRQRQLFLDDHGIAGMRHLSRVLHQPVKKGAVVRPDREWELTLQTRCAPAWDPEVERYKLWLVTSTTIPGVAEMTYAESEDGVRWTKPELRQKPIQGCLENNVVTVDPQLEWPANAMENVVVDPDDPDPSRRFKGLLNASGREPIVSPDGIHWTRLDVPALPSQDESNLSYDRESRSFIATLKCGGPHGRSQGIWVSSDFEQWTGTEAVFHADELDQELGRGHIQARLADATLHQPHSVDPQNCGVDVYNLGVSRYEGLYVGFPAMFHHTESMGFHLVQLACSRDLVTWKRLGERQTFIGPSRADSQAYDLTQILPPSSPLVHGDELWLYYTGIKYRDPPEGARDIGAVCLAVLRRDGFVSLDAGDREGTVLTESFAAPGRKLFANVDAHHGSLGAELLDEAGNVLAVSAPVEGDQPRAELQWQEGRLDYTAGEAVSIRFTLRKASLYSYWFGGE
jgi:hypothetical protein